MGAGDGNVGAAGKAEAQPLEHVPGTVVVQHDVGEGQTAALGHPLGHVHHGQTGVASASVRLQGVQFAQTVGREFHDPGDEPVAVLQEDSGRRQPIDFVGDEVELVRLAVRPVLVNDGGMATLQALDINLRRYSKSRSSV